MARSTKPIDYSDIILQHPTACQAEMDTENSFTLIWDSGASACISSDKRDFKDGIKPHSGQVTGIGSGMEIAGVGMVSWHILDANGRLRCLKLPAYYIPTLKQRLLSTAVFCQTYPDNKVSVGDQLWTISENPSVPSESALNVHINPSMNLPTSTGLMSDSISKTATAFQSTVSTTQAHNMNLSEPQKELLRWHYKLGHVGMRTVQFLMRQGALAATEGLRRLHSRAAQLKPQDFPNVPPVCLENKLIALFQVRSGTW
jgi:hypothetical protein